MHRLLKFSLSTSLFLTPALVFAVNSEGIFKFIAMIRALIEGLIPVVIGLAVLTFLWGVLKYVVAKDEDSQKEARSVMLYGIIALFVMVSVWGLVNILGDTLDLSNTAPDAPALPELP